MAVKDNGSVSITGKELTNLAAGTMENFVLSKLREAGAPIIEEGNSSLMKDVTNFRWHQRYDQGTDSDVFEWERR